MGTQMIEPTFDDINGLWKAAIACEEVVGASRATLANLYEARMKKFGWVGKEEGELRFAVDRYLEHWGYSVYRPYCEANSVGAFYRKWIISFVYSDGTEERREFWAATGDDCYSAIRAECKYCAAGYQRA